MEKRKSEIATLFMVGAVIVMGVTAIISSFTQQDKKTTSSRAGTSCVSNGGQCVSRDGEQGNATSICISNGYTGVGTGTGCPTLNVCCKNSGSTTTPSRTPTPVITGVLTKCPDGSTNEEYYTCKGKYFENKNCTVPISNRVSWCKGGNTIVPSKTPTPTKKITPPTSTPIRCSAGTIETINTAGDCYKVCSSIGGSYPPSSRPYNWTGNGAYYCCCKGGLAPTTSSTASTHGCNSSSNVGGCTSDCEEKGNNMYYCASLSTSSSGSSSTGGGAYPQNTTPDFTMACCFRKADGTIRVYASAESREASQMDTPCTSASYGNAYGATEWFECPNSTVDGSSDVEYEQSVSETTTDESAASGCITMSSCSSQCSLTHPGWGCAGSSCCPSSGEVELTPTPGANGGVEGCIPNRTGVCDSVHSVFKRLIGDLGLCCVPTDTGDSTPEVSSTPAPRPTANITSAPRINGWVASSCSVECGGLGHPRADKVIYVNRVDGGVKYSLGNGGSINAGSGSYKLSSVCECGAPARVDGTTDIKSWFGSGHTYFNCTKSNDSLGWLDYNCPNGTTPLLTSTTGKWCCNKSSHD